MDFIKYAKKLLIATILIGSLTSCGQETRYNYGLNPHKMTAEVEQALLDRLMQEAERLGMPTEIATQAVNSIIEDLSQQRLIPGQDLGKLSAMASMDDPETFWSERATRILNNKVDGMEQQN